MNNEKIFEAARQAGFKTPRVNQGYPDIIVTDSRDDITDELTKFAEIIQQQSVTSCDVSKVNAELLASLKTTRTALEKILKAPSNTLSNGKAVHEMIKIAEKAIKSTEKASQL